MRTINYVVNLAHGSVVDTFEGVSGTVPEQAVLAAQRLANETGDTFAVARLEVSCQNEGNKRAPQPDLDAFPLVEGEAFEQGWSRQLDLLDGLEDALADKPVESKIFAQLKETLLPQFKKAQQGAFSGGAAWAKRKAALANEAQRRGSSLRGRRVELFRPLSEDELGRENDYLTNGGFHWPAIVLDDGTLIYAAKKGKAGPGADDEALLVPAQLVGQKIVDGEVKKVSFNMEVADVQVQVGIDE